MKFLHDIVTLFTTEYVVGTPECAKAFQIFSMFGWVFTAFAILFVAFLIVRGKEIEAKIIAKDQSVKKKEGI